MTDLDKVMTVMEASFDPHYREAWTRRQVEDSLALPSTFLLLIDAEPERSKDTFTAGFILARQAADEIELLLIAVHPDYRGHGLGRALLHQFFESAQQRNASTVFLEMRSGNPAEKLYRDEGFTQIGHRLQYYRTVTGDAIDALTFARPIG